MNGGKINWVRVILYPLKRTASYGDYSVNNGCSRGCRCGNVGCSLTVNHPDYLSVSAYSVLILGLRSANERRRYFVTTSFIGWAQTQPWYYTTYFIMLCTTQLWQPVVPPMTTKLALWQLLFFSVIKPTRVSCQRMLPLFYYYIIFPLLFPDNTENLKMSPILLNQMFRCL